MIKKIEKGRVVSYEGNHPTYDLVLLAKTWYGMLWSPRVSEKTRNAVLAALSLPPEEE